MPGESRRQDFATRWRVPEGLREEFLRREPSVTDAGPAIRALRQWLRVDATVPTWLVLPSRAVRVLWEVFTTSGDAYGFPAYRRKVYGHRGTPTSGFGDVEGLALTYGLACGDEGHRRLLTALPLLFSVDEEIGIDCGERWLLRCDTEVDCSVGPGRRCVRHELLPVVPDDLPTQPPFPGPSKGDPGVGLHWFPTGHELPSGPPSMGSPYG